MNIGEYDFTKDTVDNTNQVDAGFGLNQQQVRALVKMSNPNNFYDYTFEDIPQASTAEGIATRLTMIAFLITIPKDMMPT